jgi:hypothetical protein
MSEWPPRTEQETQAFIAAAKGEDEMSVYFTYDDDPAQHEPFMRCDVCGVNLCSVEEGDTLDVLNAVAKDHGPECPGTPPAC